jgi:hypothetical protein
LVFSFCSDTVILIILFVSIRFIRDGAQPIHKDYCAVKNKLANYGFLFRMTPHERRNYTQKPTPFIERTRLEG